MRCRERNRCGVMGRGTLLPVLWEGFEQERTLFQILGRSRRCNGERGFEQEAGWVEERRGDQ